MTAAKTIAGMPRRKPRDPIVAAKKRLDAAGEDDVAHTAAMVDLENETPTTRKGADVLEMHVRYLQKLARHDVLDQHRLRHLTAMMKRAIGCRAQCASKVTG